MAFPVLYNFAANREASIESSLICQGARGGRTWDVRFIRGPNDWEADVMDDFFRFLAANLPLGIDGDRLRWKLTKNEDFTICSYYHKLYGSSSVVSSLNYVNSFFSSLETKIGIKKKHFSIV